MTEILGYLVLVGVVVLYLVWEWQQSDPAKIHRARR
jgi:hypothetical protein